MVRASTLAAGTLLTLGLLGVGSVVASAVLWSGEESVTVATASSTDVWSVSMLVPEETAATAQQPQSPAQSPARLRISSLGIDAAVQHTGVNAAGRMATPSNFTDVAWYKLGPAPGAPGNAVIAGHVDNGLGLPAVFKRLGELKTGSVIEVETQGGDVLRFAVTGRESVPYDARGSQKIFIGTAVPQLVLVTCEGEWLADKKTYDRRLVVYAQLLP